MGVGATIMVKHDGINCIDHGQESWLLAFDCSINVANGLYTLLTFYLGHHLM